MEEFSERLLRIVSDMIFATRERYESTMAQMARDGVGKDLRKVSYEQVRDLVRAGEYDRAPVGTEFITSALPACLWSEQPARHAVGFGMPGTTVLLPVTSSLFAMGSFDGAEGSFDVQREQVASLNLAIALRKHGVLALRPLRNG